MFFSRWNDREATIEVRSKRVENFADRPAREGKVYDVNDVQVTVWSDGTVTAHRARYTSSNPQSTFPNMTFEEGTLRLPIEDLVSVILQRITATELAEGIVHDKDARERLIEVLGHRWDDLVGDEDRRKFLHEIKSAVHDAALDKLKDAMCTLERAARDKWHYYNKIGQFHYWWNGVKETIANFNCTGFNPQDLLSRIEERHGAGFKAVNDTEEAEFGIGKKHWNEARDHWRKRAEEMYSFPIQEQENGN